MFLSISCFLVLLSVLSYLDLRKRWKSITRGIKKCHQGNGGNENEDGNETSSHFLHFLSSHPEMRCETFSRLSSTPWDRISCLLFQAKSSDFTDSTLVAVKWKALLRTFHLNSPKSIRFLIRCWILWSRKTWVESWLLGIRYRTLSDQISITLHHLRAFHC